MYHPFPARTIHPRKTALSLLLVAMLAPLPVLAQSTVGDILGHVPAAAGGSVQIRHLDAGTVRQARINADGRFRLPALSTGQYEVRVTRPDGTTEARQVTVVAGQTAQADFDAPATLATVRVRASGVAPIDLGSVETRTTFTAEQLNRLPVARDITSVSLLTPGTVASSGFFGPASFGGASAAENSYYVNGFNVTNLFDSLSFAEVPFQAIDQLDVQTGGYGARYGFSTGGVTSVNVKRGTNTWKGGASWSAAPAALRANAPDTLRTDGSLLRSYDNNRQSSDVFSAWVGGPLLEDRLFIFALGSLERNDHTSFAGRTSSGPRRPDDPDTPVPPTSLSSSAQDYRSRDPYGLLKLDWYLNDRNHLEYTGFDNRRRYHYDYYDADYDSAAPDGEATRTDYRGRLEGRAGGSTHVFKWTSQLSDDLTASVQHGRMRNTNGVYTRSPDGQRADYDGNIDSPDGDCPYVIDRVLGKQVGCAVDSQIGLRNGSNQRTNSQADMVWQVGNHQLGGGYSKEDWTSVQGTAYSSGAYWNLYADYAQRINFRTGGRIQVKQASWYLEDHWQVNDRLMLYAGLRNDAFDNRNGSGTTFVKQDNIWQPRLGLSWDPSGDGDSKLFASLGRYSLPIAANVALRAATASYYTMDYYTYDGYDPVTGKPNITGSYRDGSADAVVNGADGNTPDPRAVASHGLKPYTQDELILGYQRQVHSDRDWLDGWTLGAKVTLRRINQVIDDTCDARALYNAAKDAGYDVSHWDSQWEVPSGLPGCWLYNPGSDLSLDIDVDGDGKPDRITIPGDALGPKARRSYRSLTLSAEKRTDRWSASASYTWAKLYGNYEGLVKSTNGQDDTGTTSDFDFKELSYGADGYLFNDRRHSLKVFGSYQLTPEWQLGANLLVQSGTPISCLGGGNGTFDTEYGYRGVFHTCNVGQDDIAKLGSAGRTPWTATFNPNVVYSPAALKGLSVQLSVINLFNSVKPMQVYEQRYDVNAAGTVTDYFDYGKARYNTTPRYARVQVQYDW
ncbi:TonB-dependent receptor [Stenotrophomonas sp.]|uniref:TonB-dependent receptor n=1 Tax=Stenotrophomonas sp. TaxID=69392 RepID=UPI002FC949FB